MTLLCIEHLYKKCCLAYALEFSILLACCCLWCEYIYVFAGMAVGDEAQSIDIFEELCDICRRQGLLQDAPAGLCQNAQQQLSDLAELMRSYGFPTPGWGEEDSTEEPNGATDMAVDQVNLVTCLSFTLFRFHPEMPLLHLHPDAPEQSCSHKWPKPVARCSVALTVAWTCLFMVTGISKQHKDCACSTLL